MFKDKSQLVLNVVLVVVIAFAVYLGLMYLENQEMIKKELKAASPLPVVSKTPVREENGSLPLVPVPSKPKAAVAPAAPLYIKDDIKKLIDDSAPMKEVLKGYSSIGLVVGNESFTILLNEDGSMKDVSRGLDSGRDFVISTSADAFRKLILLVKRGNALGIVQRLNEMNFDPESKRKELIDRINSVQGFTSRIYS